MVKLIAESVGLNIFGLLLAYWYFIWCSFPNQLKLFYDLAQVLEPPFWDFLNEANAEYYTLYRSRVLIKVRTFLFQLYFILDFLIVCSEVDVVYLSHLLNLALNAFNWSLYVLLVKNLNFLFVLVLFEDLDCLLDRIVWIYCQEEVVILLI